MVTADRTLAHAVQELRNRDLKLRILQWVSQRGPFIDDDRQAEENDYFECLGLDVTDSGLGEAARRMIASHLAGSWSFVGGAVNFLHNPLVAEHGLPEERYGSYNIPNVWTEDDFNYQAGASAVAPTSWSTLAETLRLKFPQLLIAPILAENPALQQEPYSSTIGDRATELCRHLNEYMVSRNADGSDSVLSTEMVRALFTNATGSEPLFTGESDSNQRQFRRELTFSDPDDKKKTIFAHWHGKIRHRVFRMHFEWPAPRTAKRLKILYLGPKITKD